MRLTVLLFVAIQWLVAGASLAAAPAGQLDPTFGVGGKRTVGFDFGGNLADRAYAVAQAPDGRIYLAGNVTLTAQKHAIGVARLLHDGAPDNSFNNGGRLVYEHSGLGNVSIADAVVQADGKLVVTGWGKKTGETDAGLLACRFNPDGTIDSGFGDPAVLAGCAFVDYGTEAGSRAIAVLSNGEMIMAGYATVGDYARAILVKLDANGIIRNSFGEGGVRNVTASWVHAAEFVDIAITPTGTVAVVGNVVLGGTNVDWVIGRFSQTTGAHDPSFVGGIKILGISSGGSGWDIATAVRVTGDRSIVVTGLVDTGSGVHPAVAKYDEDGDPASFGTNGKRVYNPCEFNGQLLPGCDPTAYDLQPNDLAIQPDGKIVLAGVAKFSDQPGNSELFAMRLSANGARDNSFGTQGGNGFAYHDIFGGNDGVHGILTQGSRVLVAGYAATGNNADFVVARLDHGKSDTYTVTPQAGPNGSIAPAVAQTNVPHSAHVKFTIAALAGHVPVVVGCGGSLIGNVYTTAPVTANCTVTATFKSNVSVTYRAGENGSLVGGDIEAMSLPYGSDGPLVTAVPDEAHYAFGGWSDGESANPRQDMSITGDIDVTAFFQIANYKVFSEFGAGGTVSPEGSTAVVHGETLELKVMPDLGFGIATMSGCGGIRIGNTFITGPVTEDCTVATTFAPSDEIHTLTYTAGVGCSIEGNPNQAVPAGGDGAQVKAMPADGHFFVQWSDGLADATRKDTHVVGSIAVTAQCAANGTPVHLVTPAPGEGGWLSPPGAQQVAEGQAIQFTALPALGYGIASVSGCINGTLIGNKYSTGPVVSDCTVEATFMPSDAIYTLKYSAGNGGTVVGIAEQQVPSGGNGTAVTAQALGGFVFVQWSDGVAASQRTDIHVAGNLDVTAQFAPVGTAIHTVTPMLAVGGSLSPLDPQKVAEGYAIGSVDGCGTGVLVGKVYTTAPITSDCEVEATFVASDEIYLLTYAAGAGGEVLGPVQQVVASGGSGSEVVASPFAGFFFVQWTDGWSEAARKDVNVIGDINVTAQFAANGTPLFTVTPVAGPGGSFTPADPQIVAQNGVAQFTVVPADGFAIDYVKGCDGALGPGGVFTTAPVVADCQIEAGFVTDRIFANDFEIIEP